MVKYDEQSIKKMRSFTKSFFLRTEFIRKIELIPIIIFHFWANINLSNHQLLVFVKIALIVAPISFTSTMLIDFKVLSPINRYLKTQIKGKDSDKALYEKSFSRLFQMDRWSYFCILANVFTIKFIPSTDNKYDSYCYIGFRNRCCLLLFINRTSSPKNIKQRCFSSMDRTKKQI